MPQRPFHHYQAAQNRARYYRRRRVNPVLLGSLKIPKKVELLVQAVVTLGEKVEDGHIIEAVHPAWAKIVELFEKDPDALFEIDPRKMEEMIAAAYVEAGFDDVILTPRSGDFGRDVIAVKRDYITVRVIDSVKRFSPKNLVDANDVRALLGVLAGDPKATKGVVTTTSDFAPMITSDPYIAPFVPYKLELINGVQLVERLSDLAERKS